jgi:hypothetical protein
VPSEPLVRNPDRAQRLATILRRDGSQCVWCGRAFAPLVRPTTDHVVPKVKGGPSWIENEVAACRRCNGQRGHRTPIDWLDECERRGWTPNIGVLSRVMNDLAATIALRGGQRRAARYLDSQARRWSRR